MKKLVLLSILAFNLSALAESTNDYEVPWNVKEGEIKANCPKDIAEFENEVDTWFKKVSAAKDNTNFDYFLDYENAGESIERKASLIHLIFNLHTDKKIRQEAQDCQVQIGNAADKISARTDIYQALKKLKPRNKQEARLALIILKGLEESGALIDDPKKHDEYIAAQEKLNDLSTQFEKNIKDDQPSINFTEAELEGVPENVIKRFEKQSDGKLKVTTSEIDFADVVSNAKQQDTRKKLFVLYRQRVGQKNIDILKQVLALRQKSAELLGYKNWAEVKTSNRMSKNPENVFKFFDGLKAKFFAIRDRNLQTLNKYVQEEYPEMKGKKIEVWDLEYYSRLYRKKYKAYDQESVRNYFPRKKVVDEMLRFYQELFGIKFKEIENKNVWHPTVKTYEIIDGGKTIAYFYLDLEPREGKYNHQAVMGYRSGKKMKDGSYRKPIAVMMGNLAPEKDGVPALLSLNEVETLFHEFGHIMHNTLTKVPYASLAGTSVYRDFVEAPSQMLENWVYTDTLLNRISAHYKTGERIPADLVKKVRENKVATLFQSATFYARQLMYATFDMTLNSQKVDDPATLFRNMYKEYMSFDSVPGDMFPASFGHLMGYAAGYYGYLWSEVFAQDMFSKFEEQGVLNKKLGMKYRRDILEKGNMEEPMDLLRRFLGREPNQKAFLKDIEN